MTSVGMPQELCIPPTIWSGYATSRQVVLGLFRPYLKHYIRNSGNCAGRIGVYNSSAKKAAGTASVLRTTLTAMRPKLRTAASRLVVAVGFFVGLFALAVFGMTRVSLGDRDAGWFLSWFGFAGVGLLALGFLVGSLVALRHPRRAGIIFLFFLPITAFCLGYPGSGFLVWHADGGGWFESPLPLTAIALTALFFLPFVAPLFTLQHQKRAAAAFAGTAIVAVPVFIHSRWTAVLLPRLLGYSVPFLLFGLIWLGTHKIGWPPLIAAKPKSLKRQVATILAGGLLVFVLDVAATFALAVWQSTANSLDCGRKPLFEQPVSPGHTVFTARLFGVGHSRRESGRWVGQWAIGRVQERFWGLPWSAPHFVLLTNNMFWGAETYFIDGERAPGLLTRFLPMVDTGPFGCSRTRPAVYATLELHVLREARPANGPRIVGYAREPDPSRGWWVLPMPYMPFAGAKISLTGSARTTIVTTDTQGIYEVDGLPPDDYRIKLALPDSQITEDGMVEKRRMVQHGLIEQDFDVFWNGIIEGSIIDASGGPAHVWVLLQHSDGTDLGAYVRSFPDTDKHGSFRIEKIPPGTYKLTINPYGPSDDFPYAPVYYPSGRRSEDAGVVEITTGQRVKKIDFVVSRLSERNLQVRVVRHDGKAAEGAWVYVAYEHTSAYESLRNAVDFRKADHGGVAELHVYGGSRIRVFAEDIVDDNKAVADSPRYSAVVELDTTKLPADLNLVLAASTLPNSP
jgi:hypothetical protein